jgi:nicotinate-nucleotide--dimethylbenzimidazole phosphoribosyltransferase
LSCMGARPIFDLDMRLGEGSAAAIGIGVMETAIRLYREMATFQDLV